MCTDQRGKIIIIAEQVGIKQVYQMQIVKDFKMSIAGENKKTEAVHQEA